LAADQDIQPGSSVATPSEEPVAPGPPARTSPDVVLKGVSIIGSKSEIKNIAGSAAFIDKEEIRTQSYDDVNRVLRKVPGVYLREEDGFGLFPNISLRGVDPGRSSKVVIMEDGIMMAPAPYSAPAAYYFPTTGRMSGVEVIKGSSQIRFGPHSTGGVINYLSTPIPDSQEAYLKAGFGSFGEIRTHAYFGNSFDTPLGRFGYLIENWHRTNEGFKTIDTNPPDLRDGTNTGFTNIEPMIKLMWEPDSKVYQRFEGRLGYTNMVANESYLGLTTEDFRADPFRRYAASRFDNIRTEQYRSHLRHFIELSPDTNVTTTAYGNTFNRNWAKLDGCTTGGFGNLSECIENNPALLRGQAAGGLRFRNNNRKYFAYGVETLLDHTFRFSGMEHKIVTGARYHVDQIRRFQHDETFTQSANGAFTDTVVGEPGSQDSRRERTRAIALHVRDFITIGKVTLSPGLRYEHLSQSRDDLGPITVPEIRREGTMNVFSGGGGIQYDVTDQVNLFGGVWRGISTPEPAAAIDGIREESTLSFEAGARYSNPRMAFATEVALFHTDFNGLLVRDNIGSGGSLTNESVGSIRNQGVEFSIQYDPGTHLRLPFQNPWYYSMTFSHAKIRTPTTAAQQESLFAGAESGNRVPYLPPLQFQFGTGIIYKAWNLNIDVHYSDPTFTTANNSDSQLNPINNVLNARFGRTDAFFIVDVTGGYQWSKHVRLFTSFYNVTNQEYIVARHPHGPRPGIPFNVFGGMEVTFF
jgi:Fe(3+) dicitrate transport protein